MNIQEYNQLKAEQSALEQLLAEIPEENVIDRISLECRKADVDKELESKEPPHRDPTHAKITFRGKPVVGSHGMWSDFGASVIQAFNGAVTAIGASMAGTLKDRGKIPKKDQYRLLITGTAVGSFGFELEEVGSNEGWVLDETKPVASALEQTQSILRASIGTDDELVEAIEDTDRRALDALSKFLEVMVKYEAYCAIESGDHPFRFANPEQVIRCKGRLGNDSIIEDDLTLKGTFLGVLPEHRNFEFRVLDADNVIYGKIEPSVEDFSAINELVVVGKEVQISVHSKRVGDGKPLYRLLAIL